MSIQIFNISDGSNEASATSQRVGSNTLSHQSGPCDTTATPTSFFGGGGSIGGSFANRSSSSSSSIGVGSIDSETAGSCDATRFKMAAFRFENVDIDKGANIDSAKVTFVLKSKNLPAGGMTFALQALNVDDSPALTTANYTSSFGAATTASVSIDENIIDNINVDEEFDLDVKEIVQEIVNRSGWSSGNAITFLLRTTSTVPARQSLGISVGTKGGTDESAVLTIETEDLFYNRDRNILGVTAPTNITGLSLTPIYGSTAQFQSKVNSFITDDFYYELVPLSLNSLVANFNVGYQTNETNARELANFFESKSGFLPMEFNVDNSGIYKNVTGFCNSYQITVENNQNFNVSAAVTIDTAPNLLNWSGNNYTNIDFQNWVPSRSYKKYDVVFSGVNTNNLNNFFYCTGDHTSSSANSPTGASTNWTQKFFFEPDEKQSFEVGIKSDIVEFNNSFTQRLGGDKNTKNISKFDISYSFSNISNHQLKSMLHFLENKAGYRRFEHQIPSVYDRPKVYYCPAWTHTWVYSNTNNLSVNFVEDPLGVIPTEV